MTGVRQDIPYVFEMRVYNDHSEEIIAAVHEVMPEEHDGRLCDQICASVGRMVVGLLWDERPEDQTAEPRSTTDSERMPR